MSPPPCTSHGAILPVTPSDATGQGIMWLIQLVELHLGKALLHALTSDRSEEPPPPPPEAGRPLEVVGGDVTMLPCIPDADASVPTAPKASPVEKPSIFCSDAWL